MHIDAQSSLNTWRRRLPGVRTAVSLCIGLEILVGGTTAVSAGEYVTRDCVTAPRLNVRREPPPAFSPRDIRAVVRSPRLTTFDTGGAPTNFPLDYAGALNAAPDRWHVEVDVLRSADLDPDAQRTDGVPNWIRIDSFDATIGGPTVFSFSTAAARPFSSLPEAWRPGGLGRLRFVAVLDQYPDQCAFLPALDRDGLDPANAATIVVADSSVDPTLPPGQTAASIRNKFNEHTPNYLSANRRIPFWLFPTTPDAETSRLELQQRTTADYYRAVGTNRDGTGRSISLMLPNLDAFKAHYFERPLESDDLCAPNEPEQMATYFNKGDLGIGREMHCIYRGCTAELACYVRNFAAEVNVCRPPEPCKDEPVFDDKDQAFGAVLDDHPFATVAMVERGNMIERGLERQQRGLPDLPNGVFFAVYGPDDQLLTGPAQLDNKAFNTSIPGNCLQCHGISSRYHVHGSRIHEVTNAMFLPFDLDAFEFFSDDPGDHRSRAFQEPAFRAFNRMVLRSALGRSSAARELIEGWYQGDLSDRADHDFREFVPAAWQDAVDERGNPDILARLHDLQLYRNFVAVGCRGCHLSAVNPVSLQPVDLTFATAGDFDARLPTSQTIVCGRPPLAPALRHRMPAAEQTVKVLWRSEGRQHFFAQVPRAFGDCSP